MLSGLSFCMATQSTSGGAGVWTKMRIGLFCIWYGVFWTISSKQATSSDFCKREVSARWTDTVPGREVDGHMSGPIKISSSAAASSAACISFLRDERPSLAQGLPKWPSLKASDCQLPYEPCITHCDKPAALLVAQCLCWIACDWVAGVNT